MEMVRISASETRPEGGREFTSRLHPSVKKCKNKSYTCTKHLPGNHFENFEYVSRTKLSSLMQGPVHALMLALTRPLGDESGAFLWGQSKRPASTMRYGVITPACASVN
jgi:hypothetical protein